MSESSSANTRKASEWQLVLAPLSSAVPTIFIVLMTFASYVAAGVYGIATVLAGTIISSTRIFDAVTDPLLALICDRLKVGKFGRCRIFTIIGWLIMAAAVFCMFNLGLGGGQGGTSLLMFILLYSLYIIGYTVFGIGANLVQPILTTDPRQRASLGRWQAVYSAIISSCFSLVLAAVLMPKHKGELGLPLFADLSLLVMGITFAMTMITVIVVTIAKVDVPENYVSKVKQPASLKDIWDVLAHSRPMQMLIVAAGSDKLALQTASQSAINVMIFGIMLGDYRFSGTLNMINLAVTLVILLTPTVTRFAGRQGLKKANIRWTTIGAAVYALMWIFLIVVDPRNILSNSALKAIFVAMYCAMGACKMAISAVTQPMRYDVVDYEFYRTGKYLPATVTMTYSFVDKLISSLATTVVALAVSTIGYTNSMPQVADPLTNGLFWVATFLWLGMPILGYLCTLLSLHFYPLDKEMMEKVRKTNAEVRRQAAENAQEAVSE